jgi:hypothetical protein
MFKNRDNFPLHGTTCPVQREVVPRSGKQMTYIVRVSFSFLFNYLVIRILSGVPYCMNYDFVLRYFIVDNVVSNY